MCASVCARSFAEVEAAILEAAKSFIFSRSGHFYWKQVRAAVIANTGFSDDQAPMRLIKELVSPLVYNVRDAGALYCCLSLLKRPCKC